MKVLSKRFGAVSLAAARLSQAGRPARTGNRLPEPVAGTARPVFGSAPRTRRLSPARIAFCLVVLLPTLLAGLYYGLWATDRYVSESAFVVRSARQPIGGGFGSFLQMTGIVRSQDDAYSVQEYIQSRDAVDALAQRLPIREIFARPEADFLAKYPSPIYGSTDEELFLYYRKMVEVIHNASSGISTLRVQTFRSDDSLKMNEQLLALGEELVNRMNLRIRADAIRFAEEEVTRAEGRLVEAQLAITSFRNRESMLDPGKSSVIVLELVGRLSAELARTTTLVREVEAASPNSPQLPSLQRRVSALEAQIAQERARASSGADGLAEKMAEFERLNLQREFNARALAVAVTGLETARIEARRQQLYLERIVEPRPADYSAEPRRLRNVLVTFCAALLLFFVGWLLSHGVREHAVERY